MSLQLASALDADLGYGFRVHGHPFFRSPRSRGTIDIGCRFRRPLFRQISLARSFMRRGEILSGYDVAIFSGSYSPLAILGKRAGLNVAYCHTPPRFVYDLRDYYLRRLPQWQRPALRGFVKWYRPRYEQAMHGMDKIICNSETVSERIARYLNLDAIVVHPPCDTEQFRWLAQQDYYLSIARHDDLKRVDLAIRAFGAMPEQQLVVVSDGGQGRQLRRLAADSPNIRFLGSVTDQDLARLVGNAIATLYLPVDEDFGLSPIESMAAGKPVLGVRAGGLTETIVDGETGLLLPADPSVEEVIAGIRHLSPARAFAMREACERRAQKFTMSVFLDKMTNLLEDA